MRTMKNTSSGVLVLLALAGMRPVLAQADARALLTRAVVIEEEERDVARAAVEYRKVVATATDANLRAEAGVRLGTALLAMGKKDEARAVLEPLAAAGGTLGERARLLLQDQQQDDPVFAARVREALALTRRVSDLGAQELSFLGRGVVPYLMQALRAGEPDPTTGQARPIERSFLAAAVKVMCQLGGPTVADGLRELAMHSDVVVRRTCAETFDQNVAADLLPAAQEFLADADASVRLTAIRRLRDRIESGVLVRLMCDSDRGVRDYAFHLAPSRNWRTEAEDVRNAFLTAARAELGQEAPVASIALAVAATGVDATAEGRAVALALLRHPAVKLEQTQSWNAIDLPVNAHTDDLVATAEALAARDDRERLSRLSSHFVAHASRKWDRSVLPQALRLWRLGAFADGAKWLLRVLQPVDVPVVLANLDIAPTDVLEWLAKQALPGSAWKAIAAALEGRRAGGDQEAYWLAAALLRTRADEAVPLVAAIATETRRYSWVARLLAEQPEPTPAMHEAMLALLAKDFGEDDRNVQDGRNRLFVALAKSGREDAIQPLANAYALGLGDTTSNGNGIAFFRTESGRAVPGAFAGKVVDACLATGSEQAFTHAMQLAGPQDQAAPEVYAALCKHAVAAPSKYLINLITWLLRRSEVDPIAARTLYLGALQSGSPDAFQAAAQRDVPGAVPSEAIPLLAARAREEGNHHAIRTLGRSGDATQAPLLRDLVRHDNRNVRLVAAGALAKLQGGDAIDALLPLADDPDHLVRKAFVEVASQLLDRRCAPALLKVLRDEVPENRELAQKALEAIEFFHTQTARWQRILSDANLDAPTAAEALVKQATTGKDKTIRLAAIASLGTLKVPETLPVLIQLMQDADAEIAAAARAAIAKINGQ